MIVFLAVHDFRREPLADRLAYFFELKLQTNDVSGVVRFARKPMLRHLRVTNFAILSDVGIDPTPGFNALTGETGAGKSLIVEAVNLLRGGRASADIPRKGAEEAIVEAIFEVPQDLDARVRSVLEEAGLPDGDGEVLVRRVIHRGGRSRTYVNGALTTAKRLAQLGGLLVDLSGQHQHQGLVDARRHREILDAFGDHGPALERMRACHARLRDIAAALAELGGDERARAERADYLRFQLTELEDAALVEGEDEELERERARLQSVDRLQAGALAAVEQLYSADDAAADRISAAARELERLVEIDAELEGPLRQVEEARVLVEDAATAARRYADRLEGDPERLAQVEERLDLLTRLRRKHGGSIRELIARTADVRAELDGLDNRDERLAALERQRLEAEREALAAARSLTDKRRRAGKKLVRQVGSALAELGMAAAELSVAIEPRELGAEGADRVELMLASNKGEGAKPLAKIASGGELSRIMLALKLCLRRADEVATYVFDEVDTGIGGVTAEVVARLIRAVAKQRQVLCVTHLPQIAAFADGHFHVSKSESGGRTETTVRLLGHEERRDEMARMLGGARLTAAARANAEELLAAAHGQAS